MLNRVELIGGLTREPAGRFTPGGAFLCDFTLAQDFGAWDPALHQRTLRTSYIACQAWYETGESIAEAGLKPGDAIYVMGRLEQREEHREGSKAPQRKTRVVVLTWQIVRKRAGEERPPPATEF